MNKTNASPIPTNIITGFLGAGKTSTILHLLQSKPEHERWAILVNEFGEIGIDGSLFWGRHQEAEGVFVKEVPGGCMCCTAGFSVQIALNQLLTRAKPDRLLIEPTGLGHPIEVLGMLSQTCYQGLLSVQKVITLVDARKLSDQRYTEHKTFRQQMAIADVIVGNKKDLYAEDDQAHLIDFIPTVSSLNPEVIFTEQGQLDVELLEGIAQAVTHHHCQEEVNRQHVMVDAPALPDEGVLQARNKGEGFESIGWRFSPDKVFDRHRLYAFLTGLSVERMKAVFITQDGIFAYNQTSDALTEQALDECFESRIEIIAEEIDDWEAQLLSCVL
ncbi:MAG: CobW family GTP-binding protein [Cellvibrionales bacterium]|nr:CobW family GTP-binding protein [Cellvibrionales bacterium]